MTPADTQPVILRCIVGSQAHGLARPDSDYDYREVFVIPTSEMLALGRDRMKFGWMSENRHTDDEGGDEIAQWLHLVSKGAPNAVELCWAPIDTDWTPDEPLSAVMATIVPVQHMGRLLLSRDPVQSGIIGYAMNSFRKIPDRPGKWKAGMLRVLYQGEQLIATGSTSLVVPEGGWGEIVREAAADRMTEGEALDVANEIVARIKSGPSALPDKPDYATVNEWLLAIRREFWTDPRK